MTSEMWARLRAMTGEEVLAAARRDRWALRMSQAEFARTFRIPLDMLRDWEFHRRAPDEPARAYLEVIAREPDAVRRALRAKVRTAARL